MRSLFLVLMLVALPAPAQELLVAAAADLEPALREIAAGYEHESGTTLKMTFGSSGNFFTQIENGAPYDLFFSADIDYPRKLEAEGKAASGSLYKYAQGKLVMWVPTESGLDLASGLRLLNSAAVHKIAIANPQHAPYGRAAVAAMKAAGVYQAAEPKLVVGENISQAAQFAVTGNADVGLIALSLAMSPGMKGRGRYVDVPAELYPPIEQAVIVDASSKSKQAALRFLSYVKSPGAKQILRKYGFVTSD